MKIIKTLLPEDSIPSCLTIQPEPKDFYFDIETTGLSRHSSYIYLIGGAYFDAEKQAYLLIQWFAEHAMDEKELLLSFLQFLSPFSTLIDFNGSTFDVPFIKARMERHAITEWKFSLENFHFIDLYRIYSPYRDFFSLENNKQKTWENFLSTRREDKFTGGELITLYKHYATMLPCKEKDGLEQILLLHNFEDVKGLLSLKEIGNYLSVFDGKFVLTQTKVSSYLDINHTERKELYIEAALFCALPSELTYASDYYYLKIKGDSLKVRIPLFEDTFYYFYLDYRNYYYLPAEDMAVHKSVSSFVDPAYREKATPATCYQKKSGLFIRQPDEPIFSPSFYESFEQKNSRKKKYSYAVCSEHLFDTSTLALYLKTGMTR